MENGWMENGLSGCGKWKVESGKWIVESGAIPDLTQVITKLNTLKSHGHVINSGTVRKQF